MIKLQPLRCNLCGKIFTARSPDGFGEEKYDATSAAMIGLLKYGSGLPFNRLERLERNLGIPFPASTQWGIVRDAAETIEAVHTELIRQAAQGEVLHNDDTSATILELSKENKELRASGKAEAGARTGVFATCVVAVVGALRIALFFTGRHKTIRWRSFGCASTLRLNCAAPSWTAPSHQPAGNRACGKGGSASIHRTKTSPRF